MRLILGALILIALVYAVDHGMIGTRPAPGETIVNWDVASARTDALWASLRGMIPGGRGDRSAENAPKSGG